MRSASLPMYDLPAVRVATDALWAGVADHLRRAGIEDVPGALTRGRTPAELWAEPDLLLSQTCGYPLTHAWRDRLALVATPCYAVPGGADGTYHSVMVVPADSRAAAVADLRGAVAAVNGPDSQSGMNALRHAVAPHARAGRFFARVERSGGHGASLAMVREGRADVAAIDVVTHTLLARHDPDALAGTRVLARTAAAPGLPYVTAATAAPGTIERLRAGLAAAMADPSLAAARDALLLTGIALRPASDYERVLEMEQEAVAEGYPDLV